MIIKKLNETYNIEELYIYSVVYQTSSELSMTKFIVLYLSNF